MVLKRKKVTEDLSLVPISVYNKTKMIAERVLMSYSKQIKVTRLDQQQSVGILQECD